MLKLEPLVLLSEYWQWALVLLAYIPKSLGLSGRIIKV